MPPEAKPGVNAAKSANVSAFARLKQRCKPLLASGLYHSRLLAVARTFERTCVLTSAPHSRLPQLHRFRGSKFGILCYHRVGSEGVPHFSRLSPAVFEAQMRYLKKSYRIVPLSQLCTELAGERPVAPTLAITFDDGYHDLYRYAFPILRKYEIPATIYLIGRSMETGEAPWYDRIFVALAHVADTTVEMETDRLRKFDLSTPALRAEAAWQVVCYLRSIPDSRRLDWMAPFERRFKPPAEPLQRRMLGWQEVRAMHQAGVSFGAHTMTHPCVARLEPSALREELVLSKQLLEQGLGAPVDDFAYPFGRSSDVSLVASQFLARSGYRSAVTTIEGFNTFTSEPRMLNRFQVDDNPSLSLFAFNVARMFLEVTAPAHGVFQAEPIHQPAGAQSSTESGLSGMT